MESSEESSVPNSNEEQLGLGLGFQSLPEPTLDPPPPSDLDPTADKILHEEFENIALDENANDDEEIAKDDDNNDENENENESESKSESENENENSGDGSVVSKGERSKRNQYPVRPGAEDCSYYIRTGMCKFGSNCKFNHPHRRKHQAAKEKVNERDREEFPERAGQVECKYYLRTGGCKFGKACRYNHTRGKTSVVPILDVNFLGLPIRPGEKECPYYMRTGSCKYGVNCRFNHPDPTAVGGCDPPSGYGNGGSVSLQGASQSTIASWSSPRTLNETAPFVPMMFSPTQAVPPPNPEWNGYQAPVYPPERSMLPPPAYVVNNLATETGIYTQHQHRMLVEEFPERPGQPECSYFVKTGDCKYRSQCRYHHPKNRIPKSSHFALSDKGLPLRPDQNICSHYSRYGICKFGPACKFDHPINHVHLASSAVSGPDHPPPFGNSATAEGARVAGSENGSKALIQQPV